ncbi:exocyst complex component 4 [Diabrotica virgifera virgifera]|uniref:Exocyst complex component Sec8 n=1 Tax=Diabrotica virgifera virgifera TaxID=50390 RepID=A0ABM5IZN7_DIAVI|nr:exocyst complex component 4 [Diabrotica virgifera virgifera]
MDQSPPIKPPRGVKPGKETSGLLMSVIRTLSASETNEQRDREKAKLENDYKLCDQKLDELVSKHENDLTKVMQLFGSISQIVTTNREKIRRVQENLQDCKRKLGCRRDELKNLWLEGLEYKHMLQLIEEVQKMNEVPNRLSAYMARKQYLHATNLLVEAVNLGRGTLEGVESLKELGQELEQKKEQLHLQLLSELKQHLYVKPAQHILALRRQNSAQDGFFSNSPLQRSIELRRSGRKKSSISKNLFNNDNSGNEKKSIFGEDFHVEEKLEIVNPEENRSNFIAILVKSLCLLDKLPYAVKEVMQEMQLSLTQIVERTTNNIKNLVDVGDQRLILKELVQILFEQYKEVADSHYVFMTCVEQAKKAHKLEINSYDTVYFWSQVQVVMQSFVSDYLDIQYMSSDMQLSDMNNVNDISSYFSRRKQATKKNVLFKFEGSSSALSLSSTLKQVQKSKVFVCPPHPNNILVLFIPFMCFLDELDQSISIKKQGNPNLYTFLTEYVSNVYLKRKSDEILDQIETCIRKSDAWKATILLDLTSDYKPLLVSTVTVERCIREWKAVLKALPLYSEMVAGYSSKALKEYKETCDMAYRRIVQPQSEDSRKICSAAWLKDDDISRFLKSLPNWLNLKAQQEYRARGERNKKLLKREHPSEEESPEDVRMRNRREAEMLASNLGEGGVSAGEFLSDMNLLKELAQLQESMEWFSVRMFQYTSEFRQEPSGLSPPQQDNNHLDRPSPVSASILQQLTSIAQEFDELANTCLLLLHLEVRVQCFYYLLAQTHYNKETHEPDPKVLELSRVLANVDEAMANSLHPRKCKYIFEGLGHLIAKILISSAQYMNVIDEAGIQRMCRNIFTLQQTLTNITMTREVALDHARHYFELFFLTPEEILNGIVDKGPEFSELEYMNAFQLLNRSNKELGSVSVHLERLSDILGEVGVTV